MFAGGLLLGDLARVHCRRSELIDGTLEGFDLAGLVGVFDRPLLVDFD